jgi:pyruvate/2-oxoglutarate dehydrogenase complex dihydrolipoamide acyltransferase (E2) component
MNKKIGSYRVVDFPPDRRDMPGINELNSRKHFMYGLLEVDVTVPKQFIEGYRAQTGELLSFTGYLAFCLARAVDEDKAVQAYMKGRKQLVVFDDVDIGLMVERKIGEERVLMGHVIRGANHKTYLEIHQEIRSVQSKPVPPNGGMPSWFRSALLLPWPLSGWFNALVRLAINRDPTILASMAGTVGITAVGMFGKGMSGWGLVPVTHVLDLVVGSTTRKPAVVEGRIEPREILNLTMVFDHDVIDGAPATRFARRLVELIESGYGLDENQTITAIDTEPAAVRRGQVLA